MDLSDVFASEMKTAVAMRDAAEKRWAKVRAEGNRLASRIHATRKKLVEGVSGKGRPLSKRGRAQLVSQLEGDSSRYTMLFLEDLNLHDLIEKHLGRAVRAASRSARERRAAS